MTIFRILKKGLVEDWHLVRDAGRDSEISGGNRLEADGSASSQAWVETSMGSWRAEMPGDLEHP